MSFSKKKVITQTLYTFAFFFLGVFFFHSGHLNLPAELIRFIRWAGRKEKKGKET